MTFTGFRPPKIPDDHRTYDEPVQAVRALTKPSKMPHQNASGTEPEEDVGRKAQVNESRQEERPRVRDACKGVR